MPPININSFKGNDGYSYYQLYIKCPICNQEGRPVAPVFWVHADPDCEGDIYIGENAYYKCEKCGHTDHLMKWKYWCQGHSKSVDDYVELTDKSEYADVVAAAGQLVKAAGIPWLTTLLKNL